METLLHHYGYGKPKDTLDLPQFQAMADALAKKNIDEFHPGPTRGASTT